MASSDILGFESQVQMGSTLDTATRAERDALARLAAQLPGPIYLRWIVAMKDWMAQLNQTSSSKPKR